MQIEIDTSSRRQTGNASWPLNARGLIGRDIAAQAISLKALIQRDMAATTIEEANRLCDSIIAEAERVEGLEFASLEGVGIHV